VLGVVMVCLIYALPNAYPPDYAVQVKPDSPANALPQEALQEAKSALEDAAIRYKDASLVDGSLLIRLHSNKEQLQAQAVIREYFIKRDRSYIVALNLAPTTPKWLASIGGQPMKYGLDLSGGIHFLLEVDMKKAMENRLEQAADAMKSQLRQDRVRYRSVEIDDDRIVGRFRSEASRDRALELLQPQFAEYRISAPPGSEAPTLIASPLPETLIELESYAISQNLQSLRNRVNELGVSEPLVQRLGSNRIVLDLPGIQDTAEAKRIIGKVANLEFRLVALPDAQASDTQSFIYEDNNVVLERNLIVSGDRVANAQTGLDPETNLPQVNITLDGQGGELMTAATRNNVGRGMGILFKETRTRVRYEQVDGEQVERRMPYEVTRVINVATIRAVLGNRFRITGLSQGEASDLALLLRAGALAAPMYIVEERTVGASLGEENIRKGTLSVLGGLAMVVIFMIAWYKVFGLAANLALFINLTMIVAIMSLLGATLTLPGIVGIVLTVGMAVDANVLIFSRIREELAERSPQMAIHAGFDRAFITIIDANLTTLLAAIILYAIGTGPIKGFAVTLSIGILTSLFTTIIGTRAIVNLVFGNRNLKKLPI